MSSKGKVIGTRTESAIVKVARDFGFPFADRHVMKGAKDEGDIWLCPGLIIEAKGGKAAERASDQQVWLWLEETEKEIAHAGATTGLLVAKRAGVGEANAHLWWAYFTMTRFLDLVGAPEITDYQEGTVRMTLHSALALLRGAGWGEPL